MENKKRLESLGCIRYLCEPTRLTVKFPSGERGTVELRTPVAACSDDQLSDVAELLLKAEVGKALAPPLYEEEGEAYLAGPETTEKLVFARVYDAALFCGMPATVKLADILAKRARALHEGVQSKPQESWLRLLKKSKDRKTFLLFPEAAVTQ